MKNVTEKIIEGLQKPTWEVKPVQKEDRRIIFLVTTIDFGMKALSVGPNIGKKIFSILDIRTVGWFPFLESAQKCVEKNFGDIYECGSYPWVVIEEVPFGLYPPTTEWWYTWKKGEGYKPAKKPKQYRNIVCFGIG